MTRRRAFTVVELLVVIGAITILVAMVFVSIGYAHKTIAKRTTAAQLGNLKGMLVELDTANGLKTQPPAFLWWSPSNSIVSAQTYTNGAYSVDFWRSPPRSPNTAAGTFDCLSAPGTYSDDSSAFADRNAQPAVVNTTIAMQMLAALPANRSRLQNVGQKSTFIPTRVEPNQMVTAPNGNPTAASYAPLAQVQYNGKYYIASGSFTVPGNPAPGSSNQWVEAPTRTAPMLLDGWNNPIIFVPATGLRVSLKDFPDWIVISPEGKVLNNGQTGATVVQLGRPFFASAGPDGSFKTGDDNLYSFDQ
jgi:type II secretory pathway pseudopilin PulG